MTKFKEKLKERLRSIYDDDDFVNGVSSLIKTEEEYNDLMDAIEKNDDPSQVQLNALLIMKERTKEGVIVDDFSGWMNDVVISE